MRKVIVQRVKIHAILEKNVLIYTTFRCINFNTMTASMTLATIIFMNLTSNVGENGIRQFGTPPPYLYGYEEHETTCFWTFWVLPGVGFKTHFEVQRLTVRHEQLPCDDDVRQHLHDVRRHRRQRNRHRRREQERRELQRELRYLQRDNKRYRRYERLTKRAARILAGMGPITSLGI